MEKICKIVYFDEDSVTDYVQIVAGGELENILSETPSPTQHTPELEDEGDEFPF